MKSIAQNRTEKPKSKHILFNEVLDKKLEQLARASYTSQGQVVRSLVDKEYDRFQTQYEGVKQL